LLPESMLYSMEIFLAAAPSLAMAIEVMAAFLFVSVEDAPLV
jgi:hypothetical protein